MKKGNEKQRKDRLLSYNLSSGTIPKAKSIKSITEKKAIIYCRVSDKKQVTEGHGLEGQERVCKEWCAKQNPPIQIESIFLEKGVSGANMNRKAFNQALDYLSYKNKKHSIITHFVVSEASRISRPEDIAQAFTLEEKIKSYGVEIVKVDSPYIDEDTDEGKLMKTIQYAVAGYERNKIRRRAANGRRSRLLNGFRPFPSPPVGYIRNTLSKKSYNDVIDPIKGPIIKEGLELFANDTILTQTDLWKFWKEKGMTAGASNSTKLHRSFIEKTFQLHRLFFYAGYILYPEREVNEPIEGQQEALISLSTAKSIIDKLQQNHKNTNRVKIKSYKMTDEHPLRGVITCPYCRRKFTSRNTSKMVGKKGEKKKKHYTYYGCNFIGCDHRLNIPKKKLEEEYNQLLNSMQINEKILSLIEKKFEEVRELAGKNRVSTQESKKNRIIQIKQRQNSIEEALLRTKVVKIQNKYEEERGILESEKDALEETVEESVTLDQRQRILLTKVKDLFTDPQGIWEMSNPTMRQLLITVRFGNNLTYTKKEGLQTAGSTTLYGVFMGLRDQISTHWATWDSNPGPWA